MSLLGRLPRVRKHETPIAVVDFDTVDHGLESVRVGYWVCPDCRRVVRMKDVFFAKNRQNLLRGIWICSHCSAQFDTVLTLEMVFPVKPNDVAIVVGKGGLVFAFPTAPAVR